MTSQVGRADPRHLAILEELERQENVPQRRIAENLGIATGLANRRIRELIEGGHIRVRDRNVRPYAYDLTAEGRGYLRRLSYEHHRDVLGNFRMMQEKIRKRLRQIQALGVRRLALYGAGDVMEVCCPIAQVMGFDVVGVVDDDPAQQGTEKLGMVVQPPSHITKLQPDVILITTFRHTAEIQERIGPKLRTHMEFWEL